MLAESPKPSTLKSEIVNEKDRPPNLLNGRLVPELVREVWLYRFEEKEVLRLNEGVLRITPFGVGEVSPKSGIWNKTVSGWRIRLNKGKELSVLASYGVGENPWEMFKNVFVIDKKLERVVAKSSLGPEVLCLLELTDDKPVFIPAFRGKERGGVIVTSVRDLRAPINIDWIEEFLKA